MLDPIAEEIIVQLEVRPTDGPWPVESEHKVLATIVSDAVALEKGLPHSPALHPDDPFPLLFWGPFDDITPLIVRMESRDKMNCEISDDVIIDAWKERWTIQRFIDQCVKLTPTKHEAG